MTLIKRKTRAYRGLTRMNADQKRSFITETEKSKTLKHRGTEEAEALIDEITGWEMQRSMIICRE